MAKEKIKAVIMFGVDGFPKEIKRILKEHGYKTSKPYFVVLDGTLEQRKVIAKWCGLPLPKK